MHSTVSQGIRSILAVDRSRLEPLAAVRCTFGVAAPLLLGLAMDEPLVGLSVRPAPVGDGVRDAPRFRALLKTMWMREVPPEAPTVAAPSLRWK